MEFDSSAVLSSGLPPVGVSRGPGGVRSEEIPEIRGGTLQNVTFSESLKECLVSHGPLHIREALPISFTMTFWKTSCGQTKVEKVNL